MLNQYEKRAIARITKDKTDEQRAVIGLDDTLARELIAKAKNTKLGYSVSKIEELTAQLALYQLEKEIWENVKGLEIVESNE